MSQRISSHQRRPRKACGFTLVEMLVVLAMIAILIALLLPAVQQAREAARRNQCRNNLIQIGVALNNYMMAHDVLPPGTSNQTGPIISKEAGGYHMSWVTQILPYLEQQNVYEHLDFTKSAYDPINDPARQRGFRGSSCPSDPSGGRVKSGSISYCGVHNDIETPIDVDQNGVLFLNSSIGLDEIRDGSSNTIYVLETQIGLSSALGWISGTRATLRNAVIAVSDANSEAGDEVTSPGGAKRDDVPSQGQEGGTADHRNQRPPGGVQQTFRNHDPVRRDGTALQKETAIVSANPAFVGGPSSFHHSGFHALFGDGAVRFIHDGINANLFRNLAHRADGEMTDPTF